MPTARILAVAFIAAVVFTGCHDARTDLSHQPSASTSAGEIASTDHTVLSPPNEYRRRLTQEAMRGLRYDTGRVVIDTVGAQAIVSGTDPDAARMAALAGRELRSRNALIEALRENTRAVLLDPDRAAWYEELGLTLLAKRKSAAAVAAFRSALDRDPQSVSARYHFADALNRVGDLVSALVELQRLASEAPDHGPTQRRLAVSLYYAGRHEEAQAAVRRARELGEDVPPQLEALLTGSRPQAAVREGPPLIGPEVRIDNNNASAGNETSIAARPTKPQEVVATWNDYRQGSARLGVGLSLDGGETWDDFLIRPPAQYQGSPEGDPMTAYDPRTGTLWVGAISFSPNGGVFVARKNAGDDFFQFAVMAEVTGGADKGWMAAGPDPDDPDLTRVYIAYNEGLLWSPNMGGGWIGPVYLGAGLGFLPRVGPNGELYVCYWDYSDGVMLRRSFDGGLSFGAPIRIATRMDVWGIDGSRVPGDARVAILHHLAVDPSDGTLYCVYFDTTEIAGDNRNLDLYFCKSTDQGVTWTDPVIINQDGSPPGDQFFTWLEVDDTGRLHLVFFDTRAVVQNDSDPYGFIQAYYSYSDDRGDSWTEQVLTPTPWSTQYDGFGGGFIGDYLGLAVAGRRAYPCYLKSDRGVMDVFTRVIVDVPPGDIDQDGSVDLSDTEVLFGCLTGPGGGVLTDCDRADVDGDLDVDLQDFAAESAYFGGATP